MSILMKGVALGKAQPFRSVVSHLGCHPCRPLLPRERERGVGQLRAQPLPPMIWRYNS